MVTWAQFTPVYSNSFIFFIFLLHTIFVARLVWSKNDGIMNANTITFNHQFSGHSIIRLLSIVCFSLLNSVLILASFHYWLCLVRISFDLILSLDSDLSRQFWNRQAVIFHNCSVNRFSIGWAFFLMAPTGK